MHNRIVAALQGALNQKASSAAMKTPDEKEAKEAALPAVRKKKDAGYLKAGLTPALQAQNVVEAVAVAVPAMETEPRTKMEQVQEIRYPVTTHRTRHELVLQNIIDYNRDTHLMPFIVTNAIQVE